MEVQKINISPLELGELTQPCNNLLKDVRFSLNLNKIQRDHSTGKGFNGTYQMVNQLENIVNRSQKNSSSNLDGRRSSLLRTSHQIPSSRSQRSSSQIQLKQIPIPQSMSHTPSLGYPISNKRNRCSSNLQNQQHPNNSSSNKENIPSNSHRLSTFENSQMIDGKSLNQALHSARTSINLPSTSSYMSNNQVNSSHQVSKSIIRKYSKQIKSIKDEQTYVNQLYKKGHDSQQQELQIQFEQQCHTNNSHLSLPPQQINYEGITKEINEYLSERLKNFIPPEDDSQKKFFDNVSSLLTMFEGYQLKSQKINEHIKDILNEVFTSLSSSQNKGQFSQMHLSQSYQKVKRCIQTMSQNGLSQLLPFYNASVIDICDFQNRIQQKLLQCTTGTKHDEETESAIIMKKAQENRKLMDLEEKLEQLKIENELMKKQKVTLEESYSKTLEKFKKENKEIQKQNRELQKENAKIRTQIENLQTELEQQSNLYNTKTNYQNMSYFDSINNTTIFDERRTLEQNFFSEVNGVAQQIMQMNPFLEEESQVFESKFWNSVNSFNSQFLKSNDFYSSKEVTQIITTCIENHIQFSSSPDTNFNFIKSLIVNIPSFSIISQIEYNFLQN